MGIKLIDSSLRDGGNVNDWNFGRRVLHGIIENLSEGGIDVIELGYLKNTEFDNNRNLYNTVAEAKTIIPEKDNNQEYSVMVQEDKWDWKHLEPCDGIIKHIRVSFHKYDIYEGLELCRLVKKYGYICHCNPINIMGYNDKELLDLIDKVNQISPSVFTIVDTFGSMTIDDMKRINSLLQNNLLETVRISAHLHENLGLAYSLALEFVSYFENKRDIYIDASLNGIGRIPGNLCLELIMNYLNREKNAFYNINYIYDAIDDFIAKIKSEHPWGYAVPYALSAMYNLHRTYPEFLMEKGTLKTKDIRTILESINPEEKVIFNQKYIQALYDNYQDVNIDDIDTLKMLKKIFKRKKIFILAPGESILHWENEIVNIIKRHNCIVVSVNFNHDFIPSDYVFFTNTKRYSYERKNINKEKLIITSNLLHQKIPAKYIVNYYKVSNIDGKRTTDSVLCLLNLLQSAECSKRYIAGFDGFRDKKNHFDVALDNSYHDPSHEIHVKDILEKHFCNMDLEYVTPTIYNATL